MTLIAFVDRKQMVRKGKVAGELLPQAPLIGTFTADGSATPVGGAADLLLIDDNPFEPDSWKSFQPKVVPPLLVIYHHGGIEEQDRSKWLKRVLNSNLSRAGYIRHEKGVPLFDDLAEILRAADELQRKPVIGRLLSQYGDAYQLELIDQIGAEKWLREIYDDPAEKNHCTRKIQEAFRNLTSELRDEIDPEPRRGVYQFEALSSIAQRLLRGTR